MSFYQLPRINDAKWFEINQKFLDLILEIDSSSLMMVLLLSQQKSDNLIIKTEHVYTSMSYYAYEHWLKIYLKRGDLGNTREITAVWTYFRDNQVEQLFKLFLKILEREIISFVVNFFIFLHIYFNKRGKT